MRILFFIFLIAQRIFELFIANQNADWIRKRGGYEVGKDHYIWIISIHVVLFSAIALEWLCWNTEPPRFWRSIMMIFIVLQLIRAWCVHSLGRFWNTRIFVLPGNVVRRGIYKYLRHPNYLVVSLEMFVIPLLFGAFLTAFILPVINAFFLIYVRIPIEERALRERNFV